MVEVKPFKGVTYNKEKIEKLDDVMSPPYDIISEGLQDELYNKHEKNFVKLILNKIKKDDDENNNRYIRAKKYYKDWLNENILIKNDKEAVFPYKITYKVEGKEKTMNGFFVLLKLDPDYKKVKAHERTLSKPKADRLNLMRACKSNLEPIQLLYIDEEDFIRKKIDESIDSPIIDVVGYDGFNHRLWKIENESLIDSIKEKLSDEILFIADGHHRYQTAINFADEMKKKTGITDEDASFNYRMVILANMFDEGLSILPTHRLIKMNNLDLDRVIKKLEKYFSIEKMDIDSSEKLSEKIMKKIKSENEHVFAMYNAKNYYIFSLIDEKMMDEFAPERSETWRTLDVSILHKIVLEHGFGINQDNLEDHVKYTRDGDEAIKFVDNNNFDLSFLMNATKIDELKAIADASEHMPQKSTYFLPKMLSGLVMYKMDI